MRGAVVLTMAGLTMAVLMMAGLIMAHVAPREQQTPEGLATFQKAEIDKWWPIIRSAGIGAQAQ